jgi:hypothetical protein
MSDTIGATDFVASILYCALALYFVFMLANSCISMSSRQSSRPDTYRYERKHFEI